MAVKAKAISLRNASDAVRLMKEARANRKPRPSKEAVAARKAAKEAARRKKQESEDREYLNEVLPSILRAIYRAVKRGYSKTTIKLSERNFRGDLIANALKRRGFLSEALLDGSGFHDPDMGFIHGDVTLTIRWGLKWSAEKRRSGRR